MPAEDLRNYALAKPGAWRDRPWDETVVAKVDRRIFVFLGDTSIGVKCGFTREEADEWLVRFPDDATVMAYIGRSGWNTLNIDGAIPHDELLDAIDESYHLVVSRLPKSRRPDGWDRPVALGDGP